MGAKRLNMEEFVHFHMLKRGTIGLLQGRLAGKHVLMANKNENRRIA